MRVHRASAIGFCALLVLGSFALPVLGEEEDCEQGETWNEETGECEDDGSEPEVQDSWTECRDDGNQYQVTQYDNGSQEEDNLGPCDSWIAESWCDSSDRVEEWENDAGERWQERYPDAECEQSLDSQDGRMVDSWCDGSDRVEQWENDQGDRWEQRFHDDECGQGDQIHSDQQDPYGCRDGEWWDHYLARCISEEAMRLQDAFWQCTDEAHRRVAEQQRQLDVQAREARQERRALEEEAIEHERAGRWQEAERIWEELHRLEWEDQKRFHEMEKRMAQAQNSCIDEFSEKARAAGLDYLVEEFEMHRFRSAPEPVQSRPPQPHDYGFDCSPPPAESREHRDGRAVQDRQAMRPGGDACMDDGPRHHPDEGHDPMMDASFGLPPEAQAAIREAQAWCEEQMWEIDSQRFDTDTYEEAETLEDRVRGVEAECRQRMEAIFREYDDGRQRDFDRHFGAFTMTEKGSEIEVLGTNLLFTGKPEQSRITDFNCQGTPVLSSVIPYFEIADAVPTGPNKMSFFDHMVSSGEMRDPAELSFHERDAFMIVHDDPHCTIAIKPSKAQTATEPEIKLTFPSLYTCERADRNIQCADSEDTQIHVRVQGDQPVLVDERTLIVSDHVTIRFPGGPDDDRAFDEYGKHEGFDGSAAVSFKESGLVAQTVAVGDLMMSVEESDDAEGVKITLDKATHVGSFVVIALDNLDDCDVDIEGWEVSERQRDRMELRQARNLVDALDADYEGDYAKYYTVQDEFGCQLIIANSHYSVKEFTVYPAEGGFFSAIPGFGVVLAGTGLLCAAASIRRRRA